MDANLIWTHSRNLRRPELQKFPGDFNPIVATVGIHAGSRGSFSTGERVCIQMGFRKYKLANGWSWYALLFCFASSQHLRSYQYEHRLMAVHTHDDFIVLPHWETRPPGSGPDIPLSHIILTLSQPILVLT